MKFVLLPVLLLSVCCCLSLRPAPGPITTLIIDAGHGGKDPGAVGARFYEKDITLRVALRLRDLLREQMPDLRVVLTREDDQFVTFERRATIAQANKGDFFISIHCNSMKLKNRQGAEAYVLGINEGQEGYETYIKENEAALFEENYREVYGGFDPRSPEGVIYFKVLKDVYRAESTRMAGLIQQQLHHRALRTDRGVKQAPFFVLYLSGMPSVLCEIGFISNPQEEIFLGSDLGQTAIASSICQAIRQYQTQ
ncbi:MAG: N-acetylmuramoyl-L-alanine amidase [Bacteroidia bacterium]|nr:N-acetylmuramoyl-L-alanine amidase [Bacteroidia bacterium]